MPMNQRLPTSLSAPFASSVISFLFLEKVMSFVQRRPCQPSSVMAERASSMPVLRVAPMFWVMLLKPVDHGIVRFISRSVVFAR
ncbi:hypothetical protein D3C83_61260 [compost metagenome]